MNNKHIKPGSRDQDHLDWILTGGDLLPINGKRWLDAGCGSGHLSAELVELGASESVGIDIITPESANESSNWNFLKIDLNDPHWEKQIADKFKSFDIITCFDIIEHLDSPVDFLLRMKALLTSGGKIVITTPNTGSWERIVRGDQWSGATDPQHKILFSKYSLEFLLNRVGFKVELMNAPIRKLRSLGIPHPSIGAQIFTIAQSV